MKEFILKNLFNKNGRFEGQRLTEKWFYGHGFENIWDENSEFFLCEERMFIFLRDNEIIQNTNNLTSNCLICSNKTEFLGKLTGYKKFCSESCRDVQRSLTKNLKTNEEKQLIQKKRKDTNKERYGDENYKNSEKMAETQRKFDPIKKKAINDKRRKTKKERYGDENYNNGLSISNTRINFDEETKKEITTKIKKTKEEKYGDENYNNIEKSKQTCLEKYGVEFSFQSENNKGKSKQTWFEKYGCHVSQSEEIKLKIKETMEKIDENGNNGWDRIRITNELSENWLPLDDISDFERYGRIVSKITDKQNLSILDNIEKRAHSKIKDSWHLDHKFSIYAGFKLNIPPFIIGNIINLEMLTGQNNMSKNKKCSLTVDELFNLFYGELV